MDIAPGGSVAEDIIHELMGVIHVREVVILNERGAVGPNADAVGVNLRVVETVALPTLAVLVIVVVLTIARYRT